ncbi:AraC family transcriptional regulator [Segetibacter sp.]|jgi:AraC-like DNA-binding protein|uniref:AraC family transcriptional regulator n=1 Tax=Segetibacter sp. TaxID=2231182 RepID=UPI002626CC93|nr:AraC family transcriptional regulator [Segetibacter sp.]MCW3081549.1 AraC family transcriptional regulator [Segetibacter sp.]
MKVALHKSAIPDTKIFVVKELVEKHFDPTWHSHSEYQLFFVAEGSGTRFVGDSIKLFQPGELVFTGPHLPHLWRSEECYFERKSTLQTRGIVIYLNEHFLGEDILAKEEFIPLKKLFAKSIQGLEFYGKKKEDVVQLMKELLQLQAVESIIHLLQILTLLAGSKDYHYISPITYQNPLKKSETDRMNLVYEFVLKNYRTKVTLEDVASLLHMTPTSFSRYFSTTNNKRFSRFVSEIRIKQACKMLVETNLSISDIGYDCGFNTLSNFNNQFKDVMSKTPLEYKKEFMNL